ncbi:MULTISPECIES: arabinose operon transcriptional regulator AraC [unclassified Gilliamella]|uniref:arabinose operon transcriptional regulator AraC n=1 Tax=unclassified Gilliamella TaxID=2685620 RepID=UPI00080E0C30|nr:arabinose operon transcriptional regulator AraC [Gilliamella apicola]OCG20869.1 DNA-binding transcriptional regulator AraC [Gilliamella apicola]OCG21382.1 DNA-binding transcriptional regulator AraC [Gilliamella apicola]
MSNVQQNDPLLPDYSFNVHLVSGLTPIEKSGKFDFFIDRPKGLNGYIINLTYAGQGTIYRNNDSFNCHPGDFVLFPPKEPHLYGRKEDESNWFHFWIYFKPRSTWKYLLSWENRIENTGFYRPNIKVKKELEQLFIKIVEIGQSTSIYSENLAMSMLEQFLIRRAQETSNISSKDIDIRVLQVCNYLIDTLDENEFMLDNVAQKVCLSASRISHIFKDQMGMSIGEWRQEQRISRAKILLQTTNMSIANIGRSIGFEDQLYFSRIFKKRIGLSPQKYRNSSQEQHERKIKDINSLALYDKITK